MEGNHFFKVRNSLTFKQKKSIVRDLKEYISVLQSLKVLGESIDFSHKVEGNDRLDFLKSNVKAEIAKYCSKFDNEKLVCVHGDLTGDNVLYSDTTGIFIIDFDSLEELINAVKIEINDVI